MTRKPREVREGPFTAVPGEDMLGRKWWIEGVPGLRPFSLRPKQLPALQRLLARISQPRKAKAGKRG